MLAVDVVSPSLPGTTGAFLRVVEASVVITVCPPAVVLVSLLSAAAALYPGSSGFDSLRVVPTRPNCRNTSVNADGSVIPVPQRCWQYSAKVANIKAQAADVDANGKTVYANYDYELQDVTGLCVVAITEECFYRLGPDTCLAQGLATYRAGPDWFMQFAQDVDAAPRPPPSAVALPSTQPASQAPAPDSGAPPPAAGTSAADSGTAGSGEPGSSGGGGGGNEGSSSSSLAWVAAPVAVGVVAVVLLAVVVLVWRRRRAAKASGGAGSCKPGDCEQVTTPSADGSLPASTAPSSGTPHSKRQASASDKQRSGTANGGTTGSGAARDPHMLLSTNLTALPSSSLASPTNLETRNASPVLTAGHMKSSPLPEVVMEQTPLRPGLALDVQLEMPESSTSGAAALDSEVTAAAEVLQTARNSARASAGRAAAKAPVVQLHPKVLGKGGFGRVYAGDMGGNPVAVKLITDDLDKLHPEDAAVVVRSFEQELEVLARCTHPCIVRVLAACAKPPRPCIVMERMEMSLERLLYGKPDTLLPLPVVVANPCVVKISDFCLSRLRHTLLRTLNPAAGTPAYLAPECFDVDIEGITHKADIYSWGVLVWEALAGMQPWLGLPAVNVALYVHTYKSRLPLPPVGTPGSVSDRWPPKLLRLLAECWDEDPQRRPAAAELVKRLLVLQEEHAMCSVLLSIPAAATASEDDGNDASGPEIELCLTDGSSQPAPPPARQQAAGPAAPEAAVGGSQG
ncbi:hypothetical protein HYH03_010087 [Edaphochlamys debaryana]|uniref:Protein kinase domain-containing protein n=1 Tax=Edaphochlamys debaryana TaxID=47281 RepID=A0A835Y2S2_9CHLO|nr:hypothetical protein HYH03_010087 [Edaphochlamys debaryana]|eukprot:KAG2491510.1 hypothetical protein HYH03_010087 [Edaphochlamys debaryana]